MSDAAFNVHDLFHLASVVLMAAVTIVTLKADVRWIRKWCDDHQKQDEAAFNQTREDIRELRRQVMNRDGGAP